MRMWTTEARWLHRFTNASSMHALVLRCTNKYSKMQGNADPCWMHFCKYLTKHRCMGIKERWHANALACMHNHLADLKGTQTFFVINSIKLNLTAYTALKVLSKLAELSTGGNLTSNRQCYSSFPQLSQVMVDGTIRFHSSFTLNDTDSSFIQSYKITSS